MVSLLVSPLLEYLPTTKKVAYSPSLSSHKVFPQSKIQSIQLEYYYYYQKLIFYWHNTVLQNTTNSFGPKN